MTIHPPRPRLLLVEDDPRLGPIMADYLSDGYLVTHCPDGRAGLTAALSGDHAVMIVDRRLPGMDGVELVRAVRLAHVSTPILLLTALGTVPDKIVGLDAGADDYLVKPFEFGELIARLRALLRRHDSGEPIEIGSWEFFPEIRRLSSRYAGAVDLTEKESQLLVLLSSDRVRVFGRRQIAAVVFPESAQPGVVDQYVHYLRRKAEPELIVTVRGRGYRLGSP